jgi:hypothetical protein
MEVVVGMQISSRGWRVVQIIIVTITISQGVIVVIIVIIRNIERERRISGSICSLYY